MTKLDRATLEYCAKMLGDRSNTLHEAVKTQKDSSIIDEVNAVAHELRNYAILLREEAAISPDLQKERDDAIKACDDNWVTHQQLITMQAERDTIFDNARIIVADEKARAEKAERERDIESRASLINFQELAREMTRAEDAVSLLKRCLTVPGLDPELKDDIEILLNRM